jgi:hypothetical protein
MSNLVKIDFTLPKVKFTKEELKEQVLLEVESIKNDTTLDLKQTLAAIRKIKKNYNDQRLDITREWDAVKKSFTSDVNDALAPAVEYEQELNEQALALEDERKKAKQGAISVLDGFEEFAKVFSQPPVWLNATYSINAIQEEIKGALEQMEKDKKLIHNQATLLGLSSEPYMRMYPNTIDVIFREMERDKETIDLNSKPKPVAVHNTLTIDGFIESLKSFDPVKNQDAPQHELTVTYIATVAELQLISDLRKLLGVKIKEGKRE